MISKCSKDFLVASAGLQLAIFLRFCTPLQRAASSVPGFCCRHGQSSLLAQLVFPKKGLVQTENFRSQAHCLLSSSLEVQVGMVHLRCQLLSRSTNALLWFRHRRAIGPGGQLQIYNLHVLKHKTSKARHDLLPASLRAMPSSDAPHHAWRRKTPKSFTVERNMCVSEQSSGQLLYKSWDSNRLVLKLEVSLLKVFTLERSFMPGATFHSPQDLTSLRCNFGTSRCLGNCTFWRDSSSQVQAFGLFPVALGLQENRRSLYVVLQYTSQSSKGA